MISVDSYSSSGARLFLAALVVMMSISGGLVGAQDNDFDLPPIDEPEETSPDADGVQLPPGSTTFHRFSTMESDTNDCLADAVDRDDCYAAVAAKWTESEPCDEASDRDGCLDRAGREVLPECAPPPARNIENCYLALAGQLGISSACEKVRPENRALCYTTVAGTRRDLSVIDQHVTDPEEKAIYQSVFARETLDLDVIDQIDFSHGRHPNMAYNGLMIGRFATLFRRYRSYLWLRTFVVGRAD